MRPTSIKKEVNAWWLAQPPARREELSFGYCSKTNYLHLSSTESEWIYLREQNTAQQQQIQYCLEKERLDETTILRLTKAIYSRDTQISRLKQAELMLRRFKNWCKERNKWPSKSFAERVKRYFK